MRVHFLTEDKTNNGKAINFPLLKHKRLFSDAGIDFSFFWDNPYADGLTECDALWINSKVFRSWWGNKKEALLERLAFFQSHVKEVIYFDTTDSSGTVQHEVLPYVSRYCKPFLLRNKKLYLKRFYGGRIFSDFYHQQFGILDTEELPDELGAVSDEGSLSKLGLSWNPCLGFRPRNLLKMPFFHRINFVSPKQRRPIPITCRIGISYKRETVRYQREMVYALLKRTHVVTEKIPYREYIRELHNSRIGVSPFGAGEFSYRDFELIINGCLLFKPDMSHLETWPNLYEENITYVPFQWDLSDLQEKLGIFINNPEKAIECAQTAQDKFKWYLKSREAKELFCKRVIEIVRKN